MPVFLGELLLPDTGKVRLLLREDKAALLGQMARELRGLLVPIGLEVVVFISFGLLYLFNEVKICKLLLETLQQLLQVQGLPIGHAVAIKRVLLEEVLLISALVLKEVLA